MSGNLFQLASIGQLNSIGWIAVATIAALMVFGCLRIIARQTHNLLRWHALKVQVHALRVEYRTKQMERAARPKFRARPVGRVERAAASASADDAMAKAA